MIEQTNTKSAKGLVDPIILLYDNMCKIAEKEV